MEIPPNILKELEERKARAILGENNPTSSAPDGGTSRGAAQTGADSPEPKGQTLKPEFPRSDLGNLEKPASMAQVLGQEKKSGWFGFFRKKNKVVLTSAVETQPKMNLNIPLPPIGPIGPIGLIESYPHKPGGSELFFEYVSKIAIYLAIFLTPLFFMSSSDTLGFSKQVLLSTLAFVSVAGWVGKVISAGNISWRKNAVLWPALLVAISAVFSSFFSSSFWVSFLGDTGRFAFSGISLISYLVIFYAAVQTFSRKDLTVSVWLWLSSVFAASLFGLAQIFGKFILPWESYNFRVFNTIGSPFHLAVFAASSLPFLFAFLRGAGSRRLKAIILIMAAVQMVLVILIDFRVAWISLALSGAALMLINFKNPEEFESAVSAASDAAARKEYQKSLALPVFLIVLAIAMWFVTVPAIDGFQIPTEVNPSYGASFDVMTKTLKNWPVFGSGLETFPYVYAKFKDAVLNQTNYWGVNFNDSIAEAITWPTTSGAFGTVALLSFIAVFSVYAFKRVGKRGGSESGFGSPSAKAGIFASWIFILASKFFYPTSLSLEFIFWLLPALFIVAQNNADYTRNDAEGSTAESWRYFFQAGSFKTLGIFFALMAAFLGTLMGTYFSVNRFLAERTFVKALMTEDKPENRDAVIENITKAIVSDPYEVRYFRILSQVLFQKMNDVVVEIQKRPEAERRATPEEGALLQNLTVRTINSVQRSVALDPKNVGVSTDAAESYKGLVSLVQGADDLAIQNYERAAEMEPINPYIKTQLGQLYLIKSNLFGYGGSPVDPELSAKARGLFEAAVKLNPNYANGWYFLALIQDKAGEREAALNNFRVLRAMNPSNQLIARIVQNIESGIPALGYPPQPATPPVSPAAGSAKGVPSR